jgi:ParB/RepB/Spo0J family partition protein
MKKTKKAAEISQEPPVISRDEGATTPSRVAGVYREIEASLIERGLCQTRRHFDDAALDDLADSIRVHGLMNPITVRECGGLGTVPKGYWIIAGERRVLACKRAGMKTIPAMVVEASDAEAREMCVVENMQRKDLTPMEEADGVGTLLDAGRTAQDVADRLGRSRQWVVRRANLRNLSPSIQEMLANADSNVGQMSIEALELLATMLPDVQERMMNVYRNGVPTSAWLRSQIHAELHSLKSVCFDTAACAECLKRTGVQPDLFDSGECCELGRCLDKACFDANARSALLNAIAEVRSAHPGAKILRDYDFAEVPGTVAKWDVELATKPGANTEVGFLIGETGKLRKVNIVTERKQSTEDDAPAPKQPTPEQKRRAKVVDGVVAHLERTAFASHDDPCPFETHDEHFALQSLCVFGTQNNEPWRSTEAWDKMGKDPSQTAVLFDAWCEIVPVLIARLSFDAIIRVDSAYDEANRISEVFFGVDADVLVVAHGAGKKGKAK